MSGTSCHKNIFGQNFIFNNAGNQGFLSYTWTSSADTITIASGHALQDEDPVIIDVSGGTYPTNIAADTCYYVKRLSVTTLKLATSRANLAAGTFITPAGGTGTRFMQMAESANVYLERAQRNTFGQLRADQAYGRGILLGRASYNTFSGAVVQECGLVGDGAPSPGVQPGVELRNASVGNSFPGAQITGSTKLGGNQTIGIKADTFSAANHWPTDGSMVAHPSGDLVINGKIVSLYPPVTLGSADLEASTGSPAITAFSSGRRNAWALDADAIETLQTEFVPPVSAVAVRVEVVTTNLGAGMGAAVLQVQLSAFADGQTLDVADQQQGLQTVTALGQYVQNTVAFTGLTLTPGSQTYLRIGRLATDAGDTLANDYGVIAVNIYPVFS